MLTPYNEELVIGSRFADRYQILELVGRGSMGVVYKARHELMGRVVAIKMLRSVLQLDERSIKRFEREARAASRLDHPNVIIVHDFGLTENRQPYLVMDFASGNTLYTVQKRERILRPDRAVHIFTQVCDALHHAHVQGVVHRDLKPSNIMVMQRDDDPNFVKVFDLGIAKIAWAESEHEQEALTATGEVCGSPVYLSPEQCTHSPVDHRTDIYSLGVVMYELLTGVPPLMGETVYDTIYLHVHEPPPRFNEVCDLPIPPRLEQIVMKALSKDPGDRQQSMQELRWELQAALMQHDEKLKVMAPDVAMKQRRPGVGPSGRAIPPEPSTAETLKDEIRALRASVEQIRAVPKPTADAGGRKTLGPVAMTAVLSSVVSIVATLAVLAIMNAGKSSSKIATPESDAKSLMYRAPIKKDGSLNTSNSPVRGDVYTVPSTTKEPVSTVPSSSPSAPAPQSVRPKVVHKTVDSPKQIAPRAEVAMKPQPAPNAAAPNPFFSIFEPGKSPPLSPSPAPTPTPAQEQQPIQQQQQAPPHVVQPALPPQPTTEDQQQAVALNNEAVSLLTTDPGGAIDKLNRALKLNPSYTKARLHLGNAYHNLANRQRATDKISAINNYRLSLDILKEAVGESSPAWQATKQDYESLLQSVR